MLFRCNQEPVLAHLMKEEPRCQEYWRVARSELSNSFCWGLESFSLVYGVNIIYTHILRSRPHAAEPNLREVIGFFNNSSIVLQDSKWQDRGRFIQWPEYLDFRTQTPTRVQWIIFTWPGRRAGCSPIPECLAWRAARWKSRLHRQASITVCILFQPLRLPWIVLYCQQSLTQGIWDIKCTVWPRCKPTGRTDCTSISKYCHTPLCVLCQTLLLGQIIWDPDTSL